VAAPLPERQRDAVLLRHEPVVLNPISGGDTRERRARAGAVLLRGPGGVRSYAKARRQDRCGPERLGARQAAGWVRAHVQRRRPTRAVRVRVRGARRSAFGKERRMRGRIAVAAVTAGVSMVPSSASGASASPGAGAAGCQAAF